MRYIYAILCYAGNGGLSSAAKLALGGKKVLLLEKHNIPGGFKQALPADRKEDEKNLYQRFPQEKQNILKYFKTIFEFSRESEEFLAMQANSSTDSSYLKKFITKTFFRKKFPMLAKYGLRSTQEVFYEFFQSQELQLCLNAYWRFMGMSPEKFSFSILARCTVI